ncbi:hypothetical protein, partial [Fischerella thermalis]|uniref:hypothetical protein n=1 Tax=Fischerella thermalis TaxID=372787 RepID=UPI0011AF57A3
MGYNRVSPYGERRYINDETTDDGAIWAFGDSRAGARASRRAQHPQQVRRAPRLADQLHRLRRPSG